MRGVGNVTWVCHAESGKCPEWCGVLQCLEGGHAVEQLSICAYFCIPDFFGVHVFEIDA